MCKILTDPPTPLENFFGRRRNRGGLGVVDEFGVNPSLLDQSKPQ
jgi:hypothetical protein